MGHRTTGILIVDGMSCSHCEKRLEAAVGALDGVQKVSASAPLAEVRVVYDSERVTFEAIAAAIRGAGYPLRGDAPAAPRAETHRAEAPAETSPAAPTAAAVPEPAPPHPRPRAWYRFLGLLAVVAAVYLVIRYTAGFTFLPTVSQSMGYGLLFVVGLLTSLHCIAMCGGIALSQGIKRREEESAAAACPRPSAAGKIAPSLLYNAGRIVSYTAIGGIVGGFGSLFGLSTTLRGAMPVVAGAFMLFLGVRMLGIFPWLSRLKVRIPGIPEQKVAAAASGRGPFVVGLLNGLMPCGPLQTLQVYALGTGSIFAGALSMLVFSAGTVPLLLGFGAISSLLSARFNRHMVKASGVLVAVLGLVMFTRGLNLFGVALPSLPGGSGGAKAAVSKIENGYQTVSTTVESDRYHPLIVQLGVPVRWTVSVQADQLNNCNNPLTVPHYGIRKRLVPGDNLIEFTPDRVGATTYTCWMGMIASSIRVVPDVARLSARDLEWRGDDRRSARRQLTADSVQIAKIDGGMQVANISVGENGYAPAVVVAKKGVKTRIRFTVTRLTSCNAIVDFPEYQGRLNLAQGQRETPPLDVSEDFRFQCGMGMLYGYVKVVDDPSRVDRAAVAKEVSARIPVGGRSCCAR